MNIKNYSFFNFASAPVTVYDPLEDPQAEKKDKWNQVLNSPENKAKLDALLTVTKGIEFEPNFVKIRFREILEFFSKLS